MMDWSDVESNDRNIAVRDRSDYVTLHRKLEGREAVIDQVNDKQCSSCCFYQCLMAKTDMCSRPESSQAVENQKQAYN